MLYVCGALFILTIVVRISDEIRFGHLSPPDDVKNIEDFRQWNPSFTTAEIVTFHGSTYYVVRGPFARFKPSAYSEYYFDQNGNYVGRNVDPGDFREPAIFTARDAQRKPIDIKQIPMNRP
jgi:hypothetical protein